MIDEFKHQDDFNPVEINKLLLERYGKELDGRPRFRLVWADNQLEKRHGEFEIYCGDIYIRTEIGVQEMPKYSWISNRWILERLVFGAPLPAIINDKPGSYECLWVFSASDGSFLTPHWWAVEHVVQAVLNRHLFLTKSRISGDKVSRNEFEAAKLKRRAFFRDVISDDAFYGKLNPASGEGVGYRKPMMSGTELS